MKTEIRTIEEKEFNLLAETAEEIWRDSYREMLTADQITYMLDRFQSVKAFRQQASQGYTYRGLFADGKLVGFTGSVPEGNRVFLSKLYLKSQFHGQGLGTRLLNDVKSLYPEAESIYLTVNKHNPSYQLYLHWGFKVTDAVVTDIGSGYVMDDYIMEMKLK